MKKYSQLNLNIFTLGVMDKTNLSEEVVEEEETLDELCHNT